MLPPDRTPGPIGYRSSRWNEPESGGHLWTWKKNGELEHKSIKRKESTRTEKPGEDERGKSRVDEKDRRWHSSHSLSCTKSLSCSFGLFRDLLPFCVSLFLSCFMVFVSFAVILVSTTSVILIVRCSYLYKQSPVVGTCHESNIGLQK